MKNKHGKIVETVSTNLTNEQKRQAMAIKMIFDADFYNDQQELFTLYKILIVALDDVNNRLQDGLFCMMKSKKISQLIQNAATANLRLLEAVRKDEEYDYGHNDEIFDDSARIGLELVDVCKMIVNYMTATEDQWRQEEFNKCMKRIIPDSVFNDHVERTEKFLAEKYKEERARILANAKQEKTMESQSA